MDSYYHDIDGGKAEMRAAAEWALSWFEGQFQQRPASVIMHPKTALKFVSVHGDWPPAWPPLVESSNVRPGRMVMERAPVGQMRLL